MLSTPSGYDDLSDKGKAAVDGQMAKYGLTREAMDAELESVVKANMDKSGWYRDRQRENAEIAKETGFSEKQVSASFSALSPRCDYDVNVAAHRDLLRLRREHPDWSDEKIASREGTAGTALRRVPPDNVKLASAMTRDGANMDRLTGPKRRSFHNNMMQPGETRDVTVDTWMGQLAVRASTNNMNGASTGLTGRAERNANKKAAVSFIGAQSTVTGGGAGYVAIADSCRRVSTHLGISPDDVQGIFWSVVKPEVGAF